jgi:hypothetical protein
MRDIQNQAPNAICEMTPTPVAMNLLVNRDAAPFNDPDIRRAMQLTNEVMHDAHMHERGMLKWIDHDEIGHIVVPTSPLRFHSA